jgi:hypothetical protein
MIITNNMRQYITKFQLLEGATDKHSKAANYLDGREFKGIITIEVNWRE